MPTACLVLECILAGEEIHIVGVRIDTIFGTDWEINIRRGELENLRHV